MSRARVRNVLFCTLLPSLLALAGCAHKLTANPEPRITGILVKERFPLRVALVVTAEEQEKRYQSAFSAAGRTIETDVALGPALEETLALSLRQVFEHIAPLRRQPSPGEYHAILVPTITNHRWEGAMGWDATTIRFALTGDLQVLDEAGKELAVLKGEGQGTGQVTRTADLQPQGSLAVSQALSNLVRRWGEQLTFSTELERFASRVSPVGLAGPAGPGHPSTPPDIRISFSHPPEATRISEASITVIGLVAAPKGVSRLDLIVNGRPVPVSRDVRVQSTDIQNHPFSAQVELRPGQNLITLTAVDTTGQAAQAVRTVFREIPQATTGTAGAPRLGAGERWAVVIGIDQYRDPTIAPLRYATADAEALFRFLTTKGGVKPANARLLLNQQATQRAIREVLGGFLRQKATRDDEVIIYYAGHGTTEPDQSAEGGVAKYLVPWDADPGNLFASAIPMEEIDRVFGRVAARKILLVQDTCFSGGAGGRTFLAKGLTVRSGTLTDRFLQDLSQKEGRMILTASDVNQVSQEDPALGHGIFTHFLLEALGAADLDGDGAITVREVHLYLQRKVHERSAGVQTPQLYNIGDMVLVRK